MERTETRRRRERNDKRFRRVGNKEWEDNEVELVNFGSAMERV